MLAQTGAGRIEAIEAGLFSTGVAAAMDAAPRTQRRSKDLILFDKERELAGLRADLVTARADIKKLERRAAKAEPLAHLRLMRLRVAGQAAAEAAAAARQRLRESAATTAEAVGEVAAMKKRARSETARSAEAESGADDQQRRLHAERSRSDDRRVADKGRHRIEKAALRARVAAAQEELKALKKANLEACRATLASAEPLVVQVAKMLSLDPDSASAWLRRGKFRVSECAGTTQQERCARVAAEVIEALMRLACPTDPGGHFKRVCAAMSYHNGVEAPSTSSPAGGGGGGAAEASSSPGIDAGAVLSALLRTVGDAQKDPSHRRKHDVIHLLCLCTASGATRADINSALTAMADDGAPPQVSKRQAQNAARVASVTRTELLGTPAPKPPRARRQVAEQKLWAFLRAVTGSSHVLQQQWTTHLLHFDNTFVETAAMSRALQRVCCRRHLAGETGERRACRAICEHRGALLVPEPLRIPVPAACGPRKTPSIHFEEPDLIDSLHKAGCLHCDSDDNCARWTGPLRDRKRVLQPWRRPGHEQGVGWVGAPRGAARRGG